MDLRETPAGLECGDMGLLPLFSACSMQGTRVYVCRRGWWNCWPCC